MLYGCGDFIDDYEGITGNEAFKDHLVLMYFATVDTCSGELAALTMTPLEIRRFRLARACADDARWLQSTLDGVCRAYGSRIESAADRRLRLSWA